MSQRCDAIVIDSDSDAGPDAEALAAQPVTKRKYIRDSDSDSEPASPKGKQAAAPPAAPPASPKGKQAASPPASSAKKPKAAPRSNKHKKPSAGDGGASAKEPKGASAGGAGGAKKGLGNVQRAPAHLEKVFPGEDAAGCAAHLLEYGVAVSEPRVTAGFWDGFITDMAAVVLNQPFRDEHKVVLKNERGDVLTPDNPKYLSLLKNNLSVATRKVLRAGAALHVGFGAPCDVLLWHLACVWYLRQHPDLYNIAVYALDTPKLWVIIDRCIWKLPAEGDDEFLHWDARVGDMAFADKGDNRKHMSGKCMATDTWFIMVPGSHKEAFQREFQRLYFNSVNGEPPLYVYDGGTKFALDPAKPDPMDLWGQAVKVFVPKHCLVVWSNLTCHGVIKNPIGGKIAIGAYIGFFIAGSHPNYEKACGVDELTDRLYSLKTGMPPKLYPSFDKVKKRPEQFTRNPPGLLAYIAKMVYGHPSITTRLNAAASAREGKEVWVPDLQFHIDEAKDYVPPVLSPLGRKLAGLDAW